MVDQKKGKEKESEQLQSKGTLNTVKTQYID